MVNVKYNEPKTCEPSGIVSRHSIGSWMASSVLSGRIRTATFTLVSLSIVGEWVQLLNGWKLLQSRCIQGLTTKTYKIKSSYPSFKLTRWYATQDLMWLPLLHLRQTVVKLKIPGESAYKLTKRLFCGMAFWFVISKLITKSSSSHSCTKQCTVYNERTNEL